MTRRVLIVEDDICIARSYARALRDVAMIRKPAGVDTLNQTLEATMKGALP